MRGIRILALALLVGACSEVHLFGPDTRAPAAPRALDGWYYAGAVELTWELSPSWNGESFRVYGRRSTDSDYFLIAEVTSCIDSLCRYLDTNILANTRYEYYVAAVHVDPSVGTETSSDFSLLVDVPDFFAPPVPDGIRGVGLDGASFVAWDDNARTAADFSHYRVYLEGDGGELFLIGRSDAEGYLDLLAVNGELYNYRVTAMDSWGHESDVSAAIDISPRPDFMGELLISMGDEPGASGFRFVGDEQSNPVLSGLDPARHFHVEEVAGVWWLVPGPDAFGVQPGVFTTQLRCGPASDAGCIDIPFAPTSGFSPVAVELLSEFSYVLKVYGDDGQPHYGVIRVALQGFDGEGRAVVVFDWAYQLRPNDPFLGPGG